MKAAPVTLWVNGIALLSANGSTTVQQVNISLSNLDPVKRAVVISRLKILKSPSLLHSTPPFSTYDYKLIYTK